MKSILITSFLITLVQASVVILIPKYKFNYLSFNEEHNIENLVSINDLVLYKTSLNNFDKYKHTFNELYDIEYEQEYRVNFNVQLPMCNLNEQETIQVPWHLDRIVKRNLPLNGSYAYSEPGSCHKNHDVNIETVVVDTGCDVNHPEFEGRAEFLENFTDDNENNDANSHGSHCSGLIGSKTYGVCKDTMIKCVKVLDAEGSGTTSGVIAGMDYTFKRHLEKEKNNPKLRTIMSMSLGGGKSVVLNRVVETMVSTSDTFYIVVAAGNEDQSACNTSPASARGILTVMAMDQYDKRAYFSNFGKCADIYAPGVDILSTIPNEKTAIYSGTSMSAPAVAGVLNHILDENPHFNMKQVKAKILNDATKNVINNNPKKTPNLMVYLNRNDNIN